MHTARRKHICLVCGTFLLLPSKALLRADEPAPRVARLIQQIGSEKYSQRTKAADELSKLGPEGEHSLTTALESSDLEIRLRAGDLLRHLEVERLWSASPVTFAKDRQSVSAALADLGTQTECRVLAGDGYGEFHDTPVSLGAQTTTFWQAIDAICRQSQNKMRPYGTGRRPGLVLAAGDMGQNPVAYSGPLRAELMDARRTFIEQFDYDNLTSELTHRFQLNAQVMWESRFRLMAYRSNPEMVEAVTDAGVPLRANQPDSSSWNVAGTGIQQLSATVLLNPPAITAKKLARLVLSWELIAIGHTATLSIDDLTAGHRSHQDDAEVVLESLEHPDDDQYVVTVKILRDLTTPEPQDILLYENDVDLRDATGTSFRSQNRRATHVDGGVRLQVTFQAPSAGSVPARLELSYPRIRSQRTLEIAFHDVPLPVARPE